MSPITLRQEAAHQIRKSAHPLIGSTSDLEPLMDLIGDRRIVLLGEATHGTHEFYQSRADITRRLIEEKGFSALAIEADWPDSLSINNYINQKDPLSPASEALQPFKRFPMWMWRNREFAELISWLSLHNRKETTAHRVQVFGIDLYSLFRSIDEVIKSLQEIDPEAAEQVKQLYSCFGHAKKDPVKYGRLVRIGTHPSCEKAAIAAAEQLFNSRILRDDERFFAQRNAQLIINAEAYYRNIFSPMVNTWNIRDRHMAETVESVLEYLKHSGLPDKIVIWAHNSHIGDDRATELGRHGQWNIGQLLRQRFPDETFLLGYTTHEGQVLAASMWDMPPEVKTIVPSREDSIERVFHDSGLPAFFLDLQNEEVSGLLSENFLERAIGVVYSPESERSSHYFHARIARQFDAVIHIDSTAPVDPIDKYAVEEIEPPSEVVF